MHEQNRARPIRQSQAQNVPRRHRTAMPRPLRYPLRPQKTIEPVQRKHPHLLVVEPPNPRSKPRSYHRGRRHSLSRPRCSLADTPPKLHRRHETHSLDRTHIRLTRKRRRPETRETLETSPTLKQLARHHFRRLTRENGSQQDRHQIRVTQEGRTPLQSHLHNRWTQLARTIRRITIARHTRQPGELPAAGRGRARFGNGALLWGPRQGRFADMIVGIGATRAQSYRRHRVVLRSSRGAVQGSVGAANVGGSRLFGGLTSACGPVLLPRVGVAAPSLAAHMPAQETRRIGLPSPALTHAERCTDGSMMYFITWKTRQWAIAISFRDRGASSVFTRSSSRHCFCIRRASSASGGTAMVSRAMVS